MRLWSEGLATYVSDAMNPGAPEGAFYLSDTLGADTRRHRCTILARLATRLDSRDRAEQTLFFAPHPEQDGIPGRAGYAIGADIARAIRGTATLAEMAHWRGPALRARVEAGLVNLRTGCPAVRD